MSLQRRHRSQRLACDRSRLRADRHRLTELPAIVNRWLLRILRATERFRLFVCGDGQHVRFRRLGALLSLREEDLIFLLKLLELAHEHVLHLLHLIGKLALHFFDRVEGGAFFLDF